MMTDPPKPEGADEICPKCKRPKSKHTAEEILTCSRKMKEFEELKKVAQELSKLLSSFYELNILGTCTLILQSKN